MKRTSIFEDEYLEETMVLPFDFLRVKNTAYGGSSDDLQWALEAHAALTSQGVKNSVAQSKVRQALEKRITTGKRAEPAESWAQATIKSLKGNFRTGYQNLWRDTVANFLNYSCLTFFVLGILLVLNGESASRWIVFLGVLVVAVSVCVQEIFQRMLGHLRLTIAIVILAIFLVAMIIGIGFFATTFDLNGVASDTLPVWIMFLLGTACGILGLVLLRLTANGPLAIWHKPLADSQWERRARSYARQKLLMNEALLNQQIAAARQASAAERRPLIEMCGNPISYLKTAPKDPTYKPWIQMLGFFLLSLVLLAIGTYLWYSNESRWWLGYLLAVLLGLSSYASFREYHRTKSRQT